MFCDSCEVTRSSITSWVKFQVMQYVFQIFTLSKGTASVQRWNWLINGRDNAIEMWCSISITNYVKCEWDGLWSIKWKWIEIRWKWMTKWMRWTLVYEMNEMKLTRQICNRMIRNVTCLIKIAGKMVKTNLYNLGDQCTRNDYGYWQSMMKIRTKPGKVVVRRIWAQSLYGIRVVCLRQIKLAICLA